MAKLTGYAYWNDLRAKSLKNKPLKRTAIKKKACKIKKATKKRSVELRIYRLLRKDYLMDHPVCECGRVDESGDVCQRPSVEIHHPGGRSGSMLNEVKYWKAVARVCHNWIEANPKEAKRLGLSVNRLN